VRGRSKDGTTSRGAVRDAPPAVARTLHRISTAISDGDVAALDAAIREPFLVLRPDLTIVDASEAYLRATLTWREEIVGCRIFDVFPDNPADPDARGEHNLAASFDRVLAGAVMDAMPIQKYDVRDCVSGNGGWTEKYWSPTNAPVFAPGSREILYVIHHVRDVTPLMRAERSIAEDVIVIREMRETSEATLSELRRHQAELQVAQDAIAAALRNVDDAPAYDKSSSNVLGPYLKMPDRYLAPGEATPVTGLYRAFHRPHCTRRMTLVHMSAGQLVRKCDLCGTGPRLCLKFPALTA
jgi:hypothetical protein